MEISLYSQFKKIRLTLIENCENDWTTENICKMAHIEKSQFYNHYSFFFNTTPKADVVFARIKRAKNLLKNADINITQIAEVCGFKSASHFTRAFRKYANCSPSEYARHARKKFSAYVLYDLQEELKKMDAGNFSGGHHLASGGQIPPPLTITETDGTKSLFVSERKAMDSGPIILLPELTKLWPGDKIVVTGRLGDGKPKGDWSMMLRRYGGNYDTLAQHLIPRPDELYSISYTLDTIDLERPIQIRSTHWGKDVEPMDFFVDSILITRGQNSANIEIENRKEIYSLAKDEITHMKEGDTKEFLRSSGTPVYTIIGDCKVIHIGHRLNNWDGIDIRLENMNLKAGNRYTIRVKGRIDGHAPPGTEIMLQIIPDFMWRNSAIGEDNGNFILSHTFSIMELQTTEAVRVATNSEGANVSFFIDEIKVLSKQLIQ